MKLFRKLFLVALLGTASSCAMLFNEKTVDVSINSNPSGANIFIEGRDYGKTPAVLKLEPKKYSALLVKEGYGSTQLQLDYWVTVRNGKCVADILGTMFVIPYYSYYWSGKCNDFKQKEYFATIPHTGGIPSSGIGGNSMMNLGQNPADMINYYYNQDIMNSGASGGMNQENVNGYGAQDYGQSYGSQDSSNKPSQWQQPRYR